MALMELLENVYWLSILLFVIGLALIIIEMYTTGLGIAGFIGIISLVACIFVTAETVAQGIILTVFFAVIILIILVIFMILVSRGKLPNSVILHNSETKDGGYTGTKELDGYTGKTGVIVTDCRPVGSADFDGTKLEVVSRGEYIEKGAVIEVVEVEGNRVVVKSVS